MMMLDVQRGYFYAENKGYGVGVSRCLAFCIKEW